MCKVQLVFSDSAKYILVTPRVTEFTLYHFIKTKLQHAPDVAAQISWSKNLLVGKIRRE